MKRSNQNNIHNIVILYFSLLLFETFRNCTDYIIREMKYLLGLEGYDVIGSLCLGGQTQFGNRFQHVVIDNTTEKFVGHHFFHVHLVFGIGEFFQRENKAPVGYFAGRSFHQSDPDFIDFISNQFTIRFSISADWIGHFQLELLVSDVKQDKHSRQDL